MLTTDSRVFWENGFKSVALLANADPAAIVPVLLQAQPNKIRLKGMESEKYGEKMVAKARVIVDSANRVWRKWAKLLACQLLTRSRSADAAGDL